MSKKNFEPKITAILCRWCASAGADLAGVSRLKYPANILPIQVNCSGRIDPLFILRALEAGSDGVFIGACHEGDCHYVDGNYKAKKRIDFFKEILKPMGLDDRVTMQYVSASEGQKFKKVTTEFTNKIRKLGPTPIGTDRNLTPITITEENRKKNIIHSMVKNLADGVGYKPTEPISFPEDSVMEAYGFPKRDTEKCIGCYACFRACPENVITLEDIDDKRIYSSMLHACVDCKECEDACPHEALKVIPGFELMSYLLKLPLKDIEHELLQCNECKEYFAPVKQIDYAKDQVKKAGVNTTLDIPEQNWAVCPSCKRKLLADQVRMISLKTASTLFSDVD